MTEEQARNIRVSAHRLLRRLDAVRPILEGVHTRIIQETDGDISHEIDTVLSVLHVHAEDLRDAFNDADDESKPL